MRYNLKTPLDQRQARARLEYLIEQGARIELTEKGKAKTLSQIKYIHVCITAWGHFKGYRPEEMKHVIKAYVMPDIFAYQRKGITFYRSMADNDWFTKEVAAKVIDRMQEVAMTEDGFYIPAPHEAELIQQMENEALRYG
jgi:hypothetical protein